MTFTGNNGQPWKPGEELLETMTGSTILIGILTQTPVKIIFDNFSESENIAISINDPSGATIWKTFPPSEVLILDGDLSAFPKGTRIYGTGASGDFSIAYLYIPQ